MTEALRGWVLGLTGAGLVAAILIAAVPDGKMRRVTKLAAAFMLIAVTLRPALDFDFTVFSEALTRRRADAGEYAYKLEEANERLMRAIIEDRSAAYISDKAASLGMEAVSVTVGTKAAENGGWVAPYEVSISAACGDGQRRELTRYIEGELGVPESRQYWSVADGNGT